MARGRRWRRKPRVAWFPVFGNGLAPEGASPTIGYWEQDIIEIESNGSWSLDAFPLTYDSDVDEEAEQAQGIDPGTLRDLVEGQEYRLRRVVGHLFLSVGRYPGQTAGSSTTILADVAAGLIVARTNESGALISSPNPLRQDHANYPWIWRRKWILWNPEYASGTTQGTQFYDGHYTGAPNSNVQLVGNSGPYIDQKTARVVKHDQRLYMMIATRALIPNTGGTVPTFLGVNFDYRLLGSMKGTVVGNRGNAVR